MKRREFLAVAANTKKLEMIAFSVSRFNRPNEFLDSMQSDCSSETDHRDYVDNGIVLSDAIRRLERLEAYCAFDKAVDSGKHLLNPPSGSSFVSETSASISAKPSMLKSPIVRGSSPNCIERIQNRFKISLNVSSYLGLIESRYLRNKDCTNSISAAMERIEHLPATASNDLPVTPEMPRSLANSLIHNYYESCRFKGFKIPLEKSFLISIPDLKNNPHVQLDYTSQIIYHAVLVQGILLDPECQTGIVCTIGNLYRACRALIPDWLDTIQTNFANLFGAFLMASMPTDFNVK
ncbi:hypothetical protein PENSTE_c001G09717 [Penicillium steckii]|uniref:Transcription factor domain-containing protein n=1 Tax=Penicillium steckii TaxID=303698 RepID=A0A1V6TZI3_9EURO|nr:hypothetical protein PENSTE_c001G09717 [Penicillium steckii]